MSRFRLLGLIACCAMVLTACGQSGPQSSVAMCNDFFGKPYVKLLTSTYADKSKAELKEECESRWAGAHKEYSTLVEEAQTRTKNEARREYPKITKKFLADCENAPNVFTRGYCKMFMGAEFEDYPDGRNFCRFSYDRDCNIGYFAKGETKCDELKKNEFQSNCFAVEGAVKEDQTLCEKVEDDEGKAHCKKVVALVTKKPELCNNVEKNALGCFADLAVQKGLEVCDAAPASMKVECYAKTAHYYQDKESCKKLEGDDVAACEKEFDDIVAGKKARVKATQK